MSIPSAVARQAEEANRIIGQLAQGGAPAAGTNPEAPESQPAQPPQRSVPNLPPLPPAPDQQAPQVPQSGQAPTIPPPKDPARENDADYWRNRAQTNYGMLQAQSKELAQLRESLEHMRKDVQAFQQSKQTNEPGTKTPQPGTNAGGLEPIMGVLDQQELHDYGPDYFKMHARVNEATVKPVVDKVSTLEKSVENLNRTLFSRHERDVLAKVPAFADINNDRRFIDWLRGSIDETTGKDHLTLLNEAHKGADTDTVVAYFQAWATRPGASVESNPPGAYFEPHPGAGGAGPGFQQGGAAGRLWTSSEVKQAYADNAKGYYRANPAKWAELKLDIDKAIAEGRFDPNR